jgi:predicted TIM-barrel fold metal-dependent hydrolase
MWWKRSWPDLTENLPVDVMPCSNGEYIPPLPTERQKMAMALAEQESERLRRKMGMSRRQFVRSVAAYTVGLWAVNQIGIRFRNDAHAHNTPTTDACDLEWEGATGAATLGNLPGEFIFDIQSHHIDVDGLWRVRNPAFEVFFAAVWPQAGPLGGKPAVYSDGTIRGFGAGEVDPIANLGRFHYLKELYLDSATNMCVLSAVPSSPANQPLPIIEAAETVRTVNTLAGGTQRAIMHAFVMPNRGAYGTNQIPGAPAIKPLFMQQEFDTMEEIAALHGPGTVSKPGPNILGGWKTYCPWGDVPGASGWMFDQPIGKAFIAQVRAVAQKYGVPNVIATHKGFALPGFDQRAASPRDIGPAASQNPDIIFIVYHSGYDIGDTQGPYPTTNIVTRQGRGVDSLIKTLIQNKWDASHFVQAGKTFGNVPNVYAELGSLWRSVMNDQAQAAHALGKLIRYVGPKRVVWGTDSLWYGSPQAEIARMREFPRSNETAAWQILQETYGLQWGLDGDVEDPTVKAPVPERTIRNAILGRNAAVPYRIDPDAQRDAIACDQVHKTKDDYLVNPGSIQASAPLRTNAVHGYRTRRQLFTDLASKPWAP